MSEQNHLDQHFRKKLENYSAEPPMHLWEGIVQARSRRTLIWGKWMWLSASLLLVALGGSFAFYLSNYPAEVQATNGGLFEAFQPMWGQARPVMENPQPQAALTPALSSVAEMEEAPAKPTRSRAIAAPDLPEQVEKVAELPLEQEIAPITQNGLIFESALIPGLALASSLASNEDLPKKTCQAFKQVRTPLRIFWFAEPVVGMEIPFRSLKANEPALAEYRDARNETEYPRLSYSAGLRLEAMTNKGWNLRSGLEYLQINEFFEDRTKNEVRVVITQIYDPLGNIIGTDTTYETLDRVRITYNSYRFVDVPLMVGYQKNFNKFSLRVTAGAYLNLAFSQTGEFLDTEYQPVTFSSDVENHYRAFRPQAGLSLGGGVGFLYHINPDMQFLLEPHLRVMVDPITLDSYPLEQRYVTGGLSAGFRFRI